MNISIFGLGKLGLPLAACLAQAGHTVLGTDTEEAIVRQVNQKKAPFFEPGLDQLLAEVGDHLRATWDAAAAVLQTDVTFIVVPTPSTKDGRFSLQYVLPAVRTIGRALRGKSTPHQVIVTSTLMPGAMMARVLPALEKAARKRVGRDVGLFYKPEFIALGSVLANLQHPDLILVGTTDPETESVAAVLGRSLCRNQPPVCQMSWTSAELAKLSINTFLTAKISFANLVGELCEKLPDSDVDAVTAALGLDSRIGGKCLRAGLGYGGPCFPRDNGALQALARSLHVQAHLPRAIEKTNHQQLNRLLALVQDNLPRSGAVGIVGLAYKTATPVVEKAAGFELAAYLAERDIPVVVYDPLVRDEDISKRLSTVRRVPSAVACAQQAAVLVVCVPSPEALLLGPYLSRRAEGRPLTVIDCWRVLAKQPLAPEVRYLALGQYAMPHHQSAITAGPVSLSHDGKC